MWSLSESSRLGWSSVLDFIARLIVSLFLLIEMCLTSDGLWNVTEPVSIPIVFFRLRAQVMLIPHEAFLQPWIELALVSWAHSSMISSGISSYLLTLAGRRR